MRQTFRALARLALSVTPRLLTRPRLALEAIRAGWALRPLAGVDRDSYYRWRLFTAYGDSNATARPEDVLEFLAWRERQRS